MATPNYSMQATHGGFMDRIFQNLPKPFNPDPKPQVALTLIQQPTPQYPYLSIKDGVLYFHSLPLGTTSYTPEVAFDLTQQSLGALSSAINAGGYGYTAMVNGTQDGRTAALLLGFTNYIPSAGETTQLQMATARIWKFLHPIASALNEARSSGDDAENMMYMPYSSGFWLDNWGDWLNMPRPPGMTDAQYIAYLLWSLRLPKVENLSMAEAISAHYGVPARVLDASLYTFKVSIDASVTGNTPDVAAVVNKIKGAGLQWTLDYFNQSGENFEAAYFDMHRGQQLRDMGTFNSKLSIKENQYGYQQFVGFLFNGAALNDATLGFQRLLRDAVSMGLSFYEQSYALSRGFLVNTSLVDDDPLGGRKKLTDVEQILLSPQLADNYRNDYQTREGQPFSAGDVLGTPKLGATEMKYGVQKTTGFLFNAGMFNDTPVGGVAGNSLKDTMAMRVSASQAYQEPPVYTRNRGNGTWFMLNDTALNDATLSGNKDILETSKLSMSLKPADTYKDTAKENGFTLGWTQPEATYGYNRAASPLKLNGTGLNDATLGTASQVGDKLGTPTITAKLSDTRNFKRGSVPMFGTSGGNLLAPINDSGFYSHQKEAVFMYYNSPTDSSATFM